GYTASNRISVETADVARVSLMLAAAVAAGATASDGPNFDRKDMNPMLVPARERLFRQAEAQAKDYARAAGYARVRPIAISERVGNDYESYGSLGLMESAAVATEADLAEMAPPTPSTDVSRSLQLSISFRLER
ncbi:SIMPL domain-containing protein, partial [Sphingopyxis sp. KK2]|uniref:SIMPL domain-containing protein n=1 Tax=Sphingopyxis sp. KK2 TaxID=1855727 RepID=UPI001181913F